MVNPEQERQEPGAGVQVGSPILVPDRDAEVVGRRVLACLIDCFLVATLSSAAFAPLLFVRSGLVLVLVLLLLFCLFYATHVIVFEGFWGQTFGKMLLGIEVIREEDGSAPGPGRGALRTLMFLFADMIAGLFVMLASP